MGGSRVCVLYAQAGWAAPTNHTCPPCRMLPATSRPETGECVKAGSLGELADQCLHSEECATFAYRLGEGWGWDSGWVNGHAIALRHFNSIACPALHSVCTYCRPACPAACLSTPALP